MNKNATYKLKQNGSDCALYFTIVEDDGVIIAMFINSKDMKAFQWITALMTSYSRQLTDGTNVNVIIDDMKETFDPNGSYYPPGLGIKVNSLIHHLGLILEKHNETKPLCQ